MDLFGEPDVIENEEGTAETIINEQPQELFTHPRHMPFCLGHENKETDLLKLFNSGRMPHGIIFSGPKGIGKATFAFRLARFMLKHGGGDPNQNALFDDEPKKPQSFDIPNDDRVFRLVSSGGHPDLLTIERHYDPQKNKTPETLAVAELRKVEPFLRRTASEGGWRVVIIDDADTMNRNSQNALLKILEEPPKQTLIILIAHRAGALIPTIRSRTRTINFDPLTPEIIGDLLSRKGEMISQNQIQTLYALSDSSFGKTIQLLEEGGLEIFEETLSLLENIDRPDWPKIHAFADRLNKAGGNNEYKTFTETLLWLFKTLSFAKARGQGLSPDTLNRTPLTTIFKTLPLQDYCKSVKTLAKHSHRPNAQTLISAKR